VLKQGPVFTVKDLVVDGFDVMEALSIPEGPEVGRILEELLDMVLEEPALNTRERLLDILSGIADRKAR